MTSISYKDIIDAVQSLENKLDDKFKSIDCKFEDLDKKYPSKDSFRVVQTICFSLVGSIALAFLNQLIQRNMGTQANFIPVITPVAKMIGDTIAQVR